MCIVIITLKIIAKNKQTVKKQAKTTIYGPCHVAQLHFSHRVNNNNKTTKTKASTYCTPRIWGLRDPTGNHPASAYAAFHHGY